MLILPLEKSFDWKRPPWVTLALIVVNSMIFFVAQPIDERRFQQALNYYLASPLPVIELPLYVEALQRHGDTGKSRRLEQLLNKQAPSNGEKELLGQLILSMNYDQDFIVALRDGRIVTPEHAEFPAWREARSAYDNLLLQTVTNRYGFTPIRHNAASLVTHMFLHGGPGHLIGNMVFLFLIGFAVETALGSLRYLLCYLATGLGAVGLFWLGNPHSVVPLVGASGAITGVMGLYAGIFGLRKIRFFYSILFDFDYIRAPALIMLPLWLINEYYQLATEEGSKVAYLAHIGGLLSGGVLAWLLNHLFPRGVDLAYLDEADKQQSKQQRYQQALALLGELNIPKARSVFRELHREYPEDRDILLQYCKTAKYTPQAAEYPQLAAKVLCLPGNDEASLRLLRETFADYCKNSAEIELAPPLLLKLAMRFCKAGCLSEAENAAALLLKTTPEQKSLDEVLLALAYAWRKQGNEGKSRACLQSLCGHYPQGEAAAHARQILGGESP